MSRRLEPRIDWLMRDFGNLIDKHKRPAYPKSHTGRCEYSVVPKDHPAYRVSQWDSNYCQICGSYDWSLIGF